MFMGMRAKKEVLMKYVKHLREDQWLRICEALPGKDGDPGRSGEDNRRFIEAVLWVGRNGGKWRCLPHEYGNWNSAFQRFKRWAKRGIWQMIFNTLAVDADTEWLMIDSTIVRAHQHAAGAKGGRKIRH
jgi:transposase